MQKSQTRDERIKACEKRRAKKARCKERWAQINCRPHEHSLNEVCLRSMSIMQEAFMCRSIDRPGRCGREAMYSLITIAKFVRAMFRIAIDCFRHPFRDSEITY